MLKPSFIAMLFLKINLAIAAITLGANTLLIYPYFLYLTQISNNIAMDVSSKNYITEEEVTKYMQYVGKRGTSLYSERTYIPGTYGSATVSSTPADSNSISSNLSSGGGRYIYAPLLKTNSLGNEFVYNNSINVAVKTICDSKDLLLNATSSFDPMRDNAQMISAMDTTAYSGNLVNRGSAFKVELNTRYVITGFAFGSAISLAIPVTVQSVGVTTQYYQYDSNLATSASCT